MDDARIFSRAVEAPERLDVLAAEIAGVTRSRAGALILAIVIYLLTHPDEPALERAGLWLIAGGGLGNLWDRLVHGCVIDFIRLDFIRFAIFNPADVFVCIGAGLVVLSVFLTERRKPHD